MFSFTRVPVLFCSHLGGLKALLLLCLMTIRKKSEFVAEKNHSLSKQVELKNVSLHIMAVLQNTKAITAVTKLCHHKHSKQTYFELKQTFSADIYNNNYKYIVSKQL